MDAKFWKEARDFIDEEGAALSRSANEWLTNKVNQENQMIDGQLGNSKGFTAVFVGNQSAAQMCSQQRQDIVSHGQQTPTLMGALERQIGNLECRLAAKKALRTRLESGDVKSGDVKSLTMDDLTELLRPF